MTADENIRVNRILKDFNIGMGTLVEFLKTKKIEIDPKPTTRVTPEIYELVRKEFGQEQFIKEQSKKVAIKVKDITERAESSKVEDNDDYVPVKEVFIKTTIVEPPVTPKIVGKIDLDQLNRHSSHTDSHTDIHTPQLEKAHTDTKETKPVTTPEPESPVTEELKKEEPHDNVTTENAPSVDESEKETSPEAVRQDDEYKDKAAIVEEKKEKSEKKEDRVKTEEKVSEINKKEEPIHIETKVEKLSGLKINGSIDLSQFEKKKPDQKQNSHFNPNKGKRERIHKSGKEKVDLSKESKGTEFKQKGKPGNITQKNPKFQRNDRFKPVKNEVDEDEVQRQIKETYAKMIESKGKTKGSKYRRDKREIASQRHMEEQELQELSNNILRVTEFVTVNDLSVMMDVPVTKVIEACMNLGLMVSINQRLDAEAMVLVAEEFGYKVEFITAEIQEAIHEEEDDEMNLVTRPPIVTVMGHVDHGKTSLLDYIRKSNVIAGEAGGITQHIGAYNVKLSDGQRITFLDTPGHEAFTAMRARGAKITDMAIIIIAADDAVMPQTKEAINHAQAAGVPMIFAINKIDKPGANPDKIREQLAAMNLLVEDWGGKYQCQEISAKKGLNVDKLLEKILLEAELLDLKANPNKKAHGTVIESSLDKGRGYLATVLVQSGTLHVGDVILSGSNTGRVKAMFNERGQKVNEAGPSTPVSLLGLNGAPAAGETFNVMDDEKEARELANKREQLLRIQGLKTQKHITLEEIGRRIAVGNFQELNIIVKGDVDGSIEALSDSLIKLSTEEVHVNVIHKAVGAISESDVLLAAASNAIIIGFQVRPSANARKLAEKEEIEIRLYSIIYDAINEVKSGIEGMLAPEEKEEVIGTAEVRDVFKISKVGTVAGCMVKDGKITRNNRIRVIRDGIVVHEGTLGSLKRFKDDVKEVSAGFDCGLNVDGYNDIKIGDVIEAYTIVEIKRKL